MNINLRPKKCSGQSRYGRYGSYATEFYELVTSAVVINMFEKQSNGTDELKIHTKQSRL